MKHVQQVQHKQPKMAIHFKHAAVRRPFNAGLLGLLLPVLLFGFLALFARPVLAADMITRVGGEPVVVRQGETVEKVLVFDTDAEIAGRVTDMVVVINGNVRLEPTANVDLVVDLGGHVSNNSSTIKSGIFELNWTEKLSQEVLFGGLMLLGVGFVRVFLSLMGILLLGFGGAFLTKRLTRTGVAFAPTPARLVGIGLASALVLTVLIVLLSLTVIAIPLAALLLFFGLAAAGVGLLPLLDYWGRQFLNPVLQDPAGLKYWFLLAVLYVGLVNVPLLGILFLAGTMVAGLGLMVAWALRGTKGARHVA